MRPPCRYAYLWLRWRQWRRWSAALISLWISSSLVLASGAGAQTSQEPAVASPLDEVVSAALLSPDLSVMAAGLIDSIGGRLSGTATGMRAERWAAHWLREAGVDSVWFETVEMPVWRRGELSIAVARPAALRGRKIVALAYGYSPGIAADSLPLIDIGRGDLELLRAMEAAADGAVLLTDVISPRVVEEAVAAGAAALLRVSFEPGRLPQARVAPVEGAPAPLPILALSNEDGRWLRRLSAAGAVHLRLHVDATTAPGRAANVVGELRGSDERADGIVLLGAHLDAWDVGDGALDNGTGVLAVMAAARALAAASERPRRTVRVVFFAGEELGLLGSRAYVAAHSESLTGIAAMLNMDMVGTAQGYGATGHPEADTLFARVAKQPALRRLVLSGEVDHGGGPGSDHQPFLLAGVPTIYVRTSLPPDAVRWYHNAGDTLEKIDLDAIRGSAAAAAAVAWELADSPGRPLLHLSPEETQQLIERLGWLN